MQMAWLSSNKTGIPIEVTLKAPVIQFAVTQGNGLPPGVRKGHPAIT